MLRKALQETLQSSSLRVAEHAEFDFALAAAQVDQHSSTMNAESPQ